MEISTFLDNQTSCSCRNLSCIQNSRMNSATVEVSINSDHAADASTPESMVHGIDNYLLEFSRPFSFYLVQDEAVQFECTKTEMNRLWDDEGSAYEQTMEVKVNTTNSSKTFFVPRRNYINAAGVVQDTSLFPYHTAMYPLLDAYDCLYEPHQFQSKEEPVDEDAYRYCPSYPIQDRLLDQDMEVEDNLFGYIPSTMQAVLESLVLSKINWDNDSEDDLSTREIFLIMTKDFWRHSRDKFMILKNSSLVLNPSDLERYWATKINEIPEQCSHFLFQGSEEAFPRASMRQFGINYLPESRTERVSVLLRLLRHSLSELQRDYKISAAVLMCLQRFHDLDDVSVLRRLLAILDEEYIECDFPCNADSRIHHCRDWALQVLNPLRDLLGLGITFITEDHVYCILGFLKNVYLRGFGSLTSKDIKNNASVHLKRAIAAEGRTESFNSRIPIFLITIIIRSMGARASIELKRLEIFREELDNELVNMELCVQSLRSYMNCLRLLIHIGEITVQLLPENERFYPIASEIVKSLYYAVTVVEQVDEIFSDDLPSSESFPYLGSSSRHFHQRLCSSQRFSDQIENATEYNTKLLKKPKLPSNSSIQQKLTAEIDFLRLGRPPCNVQRVVKALFARDLVNVRLSRMGYGDFLLWCRFEVTLEDPLMYRHDYQYPVEEDDSGDSFSSDESGTWEEWDSDSKIIISQEQARARYDFSILSLARAWSAPWSPRTHMSFQPKMRLAIKTITLCTHRMGMPVDIVHRIGSFLNRDWWPDDRKECWNNDCQIASVSKATDAYSEYIRNSGSDCKQQFADFLFQVPCATLKSCPRCNVTKYCSKRCKDDSYKVSHKRCCTKPPCCKGKPTIDEIELYREVAALGSIKKPFFLDNSESDETKNNDIAADQENGDGDGDDDNESWESMDTVMDGTCEVRATDIICKFFSKHNYNA